MRSPDPDNAKIGLALIVLAWVVVSFVEVSATHRFALPAARTALAAALAVGVLKGSREASGVLLGWSAFALLLGGVWISLLIVAVGMTLFLWGGGSKAFRPMPPSIEANSELPHMGEQKDASVDTDTPPDRSDQLR